MYVYNQNKIKLSICVSCVTNALFKLYNYLYMSIIQFILQSCP
jgi:hypothetical protein